MANAYLWWEPPGGGGVQGIDLGGQLSELEEIPDHKGTRTETLGGFQRASIHLRRYRVGFVRRTTDPDVAAQLYALQDHLNCGGWCSLAADRNKAWAAYGNASMLTGHTSIKTRGNPFWVASGVVGSSDHVVLQTVGGPGRREKHSVSALNGTTLTLGEGLWGEIPGRVLVRHDRFYPLLRLPPGQGAMQMLESVQRRQVMWEFSAELLEDFVGLALWYDAIGTANFRTGGLSPADLLISATAAVGIGVGGIGKGKGA